MKTASLQLGLVLVCAGLTVWTAGGHMEEPSGLVETRVQSKCRDHFLWIQVHSTERPRFEAVDGDGVHSISEQLASLCGYTISTFRPDSVTTFRASYHSCFTQNQNDHEFTFRFNVVVSGGGSSGPSRLPVSAVCSGPTWKDREVVCEEDYMEVSVNKRSWCGGQWGEGGTAFNQARMMVASAWQLMFLLSDGQVSSMSPAEARAQGYSLTATDHRVVLRSGYRQRQASVVMVDDVPVEVIRVSVIFRRQLTVVMVDVSVSCTVNPGSFDGASLLWNVPKVMTPLVERDARLDIQMVSVGVDGVLLDQPTAGGASLVQQGGLVQIQVPFGAKGGYRKSALLNNTYTETYVVSLLYQHQFSLTYEDDSSISTRHRILRVLHTPPLCRRPFTVNETASDKEAFSIYLGNIPADVVLTEVWINRKLLLMSDQAERGVAITTVSHLNGSRAYRLRLPFEDRDVLSMYLGAGVVQYSAHINFTLTIQPQRDSYYHHAVVSAQSSNTFPPQITTQCSEGGIVFSVIQTPAAKSVWEVGVNHEPLTSQLADQRGYRLLNQTHKTSLDVPLFSIGYTYEDINLWNLYGTFQLLLRDSRTLEVQTSTSKRCLFKTPQKDLTVCSADGMVTVVTTLRPTWPAVHPETTSLLDATCRPKQRVGSRVLFEFRVNSCGTRAMVGESYVVYENQIIHNRRLIADGPNLISRESQFQLTVRCFYPLSGLNRLSVDRVFSAPGVGSVEVFQSFKGSANKIPGADCPVQVPMMNQLTPPPGISRQPKPGPKNLMVDLSPEGKPELNPHSGMMPEGVEDLPKSGLDTAARYKPDLITMTNGKQVPPTRHDSLAGTRGSESPPGSTLSSRVDQKSQRTGSMPKRDMDTLLSRVKDIVVKQRTRLGSGNGHEKTPSTEQDQSNRSGPVQKEPSRTKWTSTPLHDHSHSSSSWEKDFQTPEHEQEVLRDQDEGSTAQQDLQQLWAETGHDAGQIQSAGVSHTRLRPGPTRRLQTQDQTRQQNPDPLSRTSDFSFTTHTRHQSAGTEQT